MSDTGLVVENLTVRYGKATAVDQVSLFARSGEVTAIVGPNGAGKSSLILGVFGSIPAEGVVRVGHTDLSALSASRRAKAGLALVPQGRQLFPKLTVAENIQIMAELLGLPKSAIDGAMDRFPILRERSGQLAGVLSGGEQQMLVVGRALMASPEVLLLDETMTGLAPKIVAGLADTFAQLARDGVAVVVADPSLGPIRRIVHRGYVIVRGEFVAECDSVESLDAQYQRAMGVIQHEVESEVLSDAEHA